jgi:hypothetical protein
MRSKKIAAPGRYGTVPRVSDEHATPGLADFHARATTVAAVAGLAPACIYMDFHCSAISTMRDRDSSRGSALPRIRSNSMTALLTSDLSSVV